MYSKIRSEARRQRKILLQNIDASISRDETVDLGDLHKQLDTLATAEALRSPLEKVLHALLPVLLAAFALIPLWTIHQADPSIELSAHVTRIVTHQDTTQKLELGNFGQVNPLRAEGLNVLNSDIGDINFSHAAGNGSVYIDGATYLTNIELISLKNVDSPEREEAYRNSRIAISKHAQLGEIDLENLQVKINANFDQPAQVVTTIPKHTRLATPHDAMLALEGPEAAPARVRLFFGLGEQPIDLPIMYPRNLLLRDTSFNTSGERESFSSIEHGTLTIIDTGQKHELLRGTSLSLGELKGKLRITLAPDGLDLAFHGTAGMLGIGDESDKQFRDLRPSLAEWLSSDRDVALIWSSLLFVIGLTLSLRRSLFG
jgi:hypothetical protein